MQTTPIKKRISGMALILAGLLFLAAGSLATDWRARAIESSGMATPTPLPTRPRTVSSLPRSAATPSLGPGASLRGKQLFPPDNPWNQDITNEPVDPTSAADCRCIGRTIVSHPISARFIAAYPTGIPHCGQWIQPPAR
jgi:hypothetical protein